MTPIRKIIALAATAFTAIALSACDINAGVGIHENGTAELAMEFHDTDNLLAGQGLDSCDDFAQQVTQEALDSMPQGQVSDKEFQAILDSLEITDVSQGDKLGCRVQFTTPDSVLDTPLVQETDKTFIIDGRDAATGEVPPQVQLFTKLVDLKLIIATPGDIITAEGATTIDGNRAIFTSIESIMKNGFYIEGNKTGTDDFSNILSSSSTSGLPMWAWIVIGVVILAVIAALVFFMIRKKPETNNMQTPPQYGFAPQPNHPGQPAATNTPAPTAWPATIPTQNHSHTQPTPQATPGAQPFAQMQGHLEHDMPNIPDPTQTPSAPNAPSDPLNPTTLEGNSSSDGKNWNNYSGDDDQLS